MLSRISHRGPDDRGMFVDDGVCLGHHRLSVIDISGGHQPMSNEDGSVWITYNGEVYNFRALRAELEAAGHRFSTNSDTEVVVHGYEQWGEQVVSRLNGMFAFAVWDGARRKLLLARDRLGIKPLFFMQKDGLLLFASEMKALLEYDEYSPKLNLNALRSYLSCRYTKGSWTLLSGINKLPPGHTLSIDADGASLKRYWDVAFDVSQASEEEHVNELSRLLDDSVDSRLISDVPLGVYLSGGLDSASVVAVMSKLSSEVSTFSVGFGGWGEDELGYAKAVAEHFSTNHREIIVEPDSVKHLAEMVYYLDEPLGDIAFVPVYLMSRQAKKDVTVVLTGEGNDEVWGGYAHLQRHLTAYDLGKKLPGPLRRLIPGAARLLPSSHLKSKLLYAGRLWCDPSSFISFESVFGEGETEKLLDPAVLSKMNPLTPLELAPRDCFPDNLPFLDQMLLTDLSTVLPDCYLVKVDRMTMASGVEARVPLLDHRIVEYSYKVPWNLKLNGDVEKYIFRKAMKKHLKPEILNRKKRGFGVPAGPWMRQMEDYVSQTLDEASIRRRGIFRIDAVRRMLARAESAANKNSLGLWTLVMLELWLRMVEENWGGFS